MAKLDDLIAAAQASADSTKVSIDAAVQRAVDTATKNTQTIAALDAQIADLQAQIAAGGGNPTPAQEAALAKLTSDVDAIRTSADQIDPSNPAVIAPSP